MAKATTKTDAEWTTLDIDTLPGSVRAQYDAMKAIYRQYKDAKDAFEAGMAALAALPEGKRMVFGYNFGKLSVAVVDDDRKAGKPRQATGTLADFITAQTAAGRNA